MLHHIMNETGRFHVADDSAYCSLCKTVKLRTEFYANPRTKSKTHTYCILCHRAYYKRYNRQKGVIRPRHQESEAQPKRSLFYSHCRYCARCTQWKTKNSFYAKGSYCKSCQRDYAKSHYYDNRATQRAKRYGISEEEYQALFNQQEGRCFICNQQETRRRGSTVFELSVDHCHETGRVRGLLCHNCNVGLGQFKDDPRLLEEAITYLQKE